MAVNELPVSGWPRWVLVRRSSSDSSEMTAYVCCAPADTPLEALVQVAGQRWTVAGASCPGECTGSAAARVAVALGWPLWRRRHQARARGCHYRRQAVKRE